MTHHVYAKAIPLIAKLKTSFILSEKLLGKPITRGNNDINARGFAAVFVTGELFLRHDPQNVQHQQQFYLLTHLSEALWVVSSIATFISSIDV